MSQSPEGLLPPMGLTDNDGVEVPFTVRPTGWWEPEHPTQNPGIKWLLLHFKARTDRTYSLAIGDDPTPLQGSNLANRSGSTILVDTGPLQATLEDGVPGVFTEVSLRGKRMLEGRNALFVLTGHDGTADVPTVLTGWQLVLEEATPMKATVKGTGFFIGADDRAYARLDVRYQFFQGESYVRIYHTLTWMQKDLRFGAREISVRLKPDLDDPLALRLGLSDYDGTSFDWPPPGNAYDANEAIYVTQSVERITQPGGETVRSRAEYRINGNLNFSSDRLGGWIEWKDAAGTGIGVSVKNLWQEYPKAFQLASGELGIELWPARHARMSFAQHEIMPGDYFCDDASWRHGPQTNCPDCDAGYTGHCLYHDTADMTGFLHTGQGAAKTHELVLFFFDGDSRRSTAELNTINQHLVVLRQDPQSAMEVPFMGFRIASKSARYDDLERAIDDLGRMAVARWHYGHSYGFWRFGFTRWGRPGLGPHLYRWMDGLQYDQQLIPWLLFMRGGRRDFYEEGIHTARHAMDVGTNHFSTRASGNGFYPPGFSSSASPMPFPDLPAVLVRSTKIHYLSAYYHLTGYERAREVMEMIIDAAKEEARTDPNRLGDRTVYNLNMFWAQAYLETWDPELLPFVREWRDLTTQEEWSVCHKTWGAKDVYLYNGLVMLQRLFELGVDAQAADDLAEMMLQNLNVAGMPDLEDGGIHRTPYVIAAAWAARRSGDARFSRIAWDAARSLADLVPRFVDDPDSMPPNYKMFMGHFIWRQFLLPILVGLSEGEREQFDRRSPSRNVHDTFFPLRGVDPEGAGHATAFVRADAPAPTKLRVKPYAAPFGTQATRVPPIKVTVSAVIDEEADSDNSPSQSPPERTFQMVFPDENNLADANCLSAPNNPHLYRGRLYDTMDWDFENVLHIPDASPDVTYRLDFKVEPWPAEDAKPRVFLGAHAVDAQGDAKLVWKLNLQSVAEQCTSGADPDCLNFTHNAGEHYAGARFFALPKGNPVKIKNFIQVHAQFPHGYTVRDAESWDRIDPLSAEWSPDMQYDVEPDTLMAITVNGYDSPMAFGVHTDQVGESVPDIRPCVSATPHAWRDWQNWLPRECQ